MAKDSDYKTWGMFYAEFQRSLDELPTAERSSLLQKELPAVWTEIYKQPGLHRLAHGRFQYICDAYGASAVERTLEDDGASEPRLVSAFGRSVPALSHRKKDDYRLKGWVGPTETRYGKGSDKGHFIAQSIGGAINQAEFNVYVQCRRMNRGWSEEGQAIATEST